MALSGSHLLPLIVFAFVVSAWVCPTASAQRQPTPYVLGVYWSSEDSPANAAVDAALRQVFSRSAVPVEYSAEYLESDRFPAQEASMALRDYIRQKYQGRRIDVVLAFSDVALQFVLRNRGELFPEAPVVYAGGRWPDADTDRTTAGLTGVVYANGWRENLELVLKLHPSTERVFVIAQAPNYPLAESVRAGLRAYERRVPITYIAEPSMPRLIAAVKAVPPNSVIYYVRHSQEDHGKILFPSDVARVVAQASAAPVYADNESDIGTGVVGGMVRMESGTGSRVGHIARQILEGMHAQDIPFESATLVPLFDSRQLRRWGIHPSDLPPGSEIRFTVPTLWERYHWHIAGAIALGILQALMIVSLVIERSRRHQSQRRYALASAAARIYVWEWNLETNEVYVDPVFKTNLGYRDDEIRNHRDDWLRFAHPDDAAMVMARAQEYIDGKARSFEADFRMRHSDGTSRWFLTRGTGSLRGSRMVSMTGTLTDITDRKTSEQALENMHTELMRVSRLTALGEFAASISHEVRQPLTSIIMSARACLEWLSRPNSDLVEIRAALLDVVDSSKRADELIQRNRELFRQHTVQKERLDINAVVGDVLALARSQLRSSDVTLVTSLASHLPAIIGDRIELQQVLLNLIVNGIDATEHIESGSRRIEIATSLSRKRFVKVSVGDNGVGFAGVDLQRMFSLSYTTKTDGTGIGLSLSRSIVEAHGGELWAEQNPGAGATFSFAIPIDAVESATDREQRESVQVV